MWDLSSWKFQRNKQILLVRLNVFWVIYHTCNRTAHLFLNYNTTLPIHEKKRFCINYLNGIFVSFSRIILIIHFQKNIRVWDNTDQYIYIYIYMYQLIIETYSSATLIHAFLRDTFWDWKSQHLWEGSIYYQTCN